MKYSYEKKKKEAIIEENIYEDVIPYIIHQRSKRTKNVLFLFYYTFVVKEEN